MLRMRGPPKTVHGGGADDQRAIVGLLEPYRLQAELLEFDPQALVRPGCQVEIASRQLASGLEEP